MTMTTAMKEKEKKKNTKTLFNVPPSEQHHAARSLAPKSNGALSFIHLDSLIFIFTFAL